MARAFFNCKYLSARTQVGVCHKKSEKTLDTNILMMSSALPTNSMNVIFMYIFALNLINGSGRDFREFINSQTHPKDSTIQSSQDYEANTTANDQENQVKHPTLQLSDWTPDQSHINYLTTIFGEDTPLFSPDEISVPSSDEQTQPGDILYNHLTARNRSSNYEWDRFIFNKFNLTENRKIRNQMLISTYLQSAKMSSKQMNDLLHSQFFVDLMIKRDGEEQELQMMQKDFGIIMLLLVNIPALYKDNQIQEITELIESTPSIFDKTMKFFEKISLRFARKSEARTTDNFRNFMNPIQSTKTTDKQKDKEKVAYNKAIESANYSVVD